jgi:phosphatidylglycerol lysyltransferase
VARAPGGRVEGFLGCAPVLGRAGWYLDITRRRPDAVRGTMELLTTTALQTFGAEGATFASLGLAPLACLEGSAVPPGDSPVLCHLMRQVFAAVRSPYDYQALARYKGKYVPDAWEYRFLCYSGRLAEWGSRRVLSRLLRRSAASASPGAP